MGRGILRKVDLYTFAIAMFMSVIVGIIVFPGLAEHTFKTIVENVGSTPLVISFIIGLLNFLTEGGLRAWHNSKNIQMTIVTVVGVLLLLGAISYSQFGSLIQIKGLTFITGAIAAMYILLPFEQRIELGSVPMFVGWYMLWGICFVVGLILGWNVQFNILPF